MKIYAYKNTDDSIHISDLFDSIDTIVFVDDIRRYHPDMINASEDMDYLGMPEADLRNVPQCDLNNITDIKVLEHLHKTVPDLMTDSQKNNVINLYRTKVIKTEQDVINTISRLRACTSVYTVPTRKNVSFDQRYALTDSEKLKIVHSLKKSDYVNNTTNYIEGYSGNDLMFITKQTFKSKSGWVHKNIIVYVKIDTTQTLDSGSTVAIVSLHEAIADEPHPYKKNLESSRKITISHNTDATTIGIDANLI